MHVTGRHTFNSVDAHNKIVLVKGCVLSESFHSLPSLTRKYCHCAMRDNGLVRPLTRNLHRRPWRFWDMHIPETAWNYQRRPQFKPSVPNIYSERIRQHRSSKLYTPIPDSRLPAPWSCNWRAWGLRPYWFYPATPFPNEIESALKRRFKIFVYKVLIFRSGRVDNSSFVFVGTKNSKDDSGWAYYLYDVPTERLYCFAPTGEAEGTAEGFAENADWSKMTLLGSLIDLEPLPATGITAPNSRLPLHLHDLHRSEANNRLTQTSWQPEPRVTRAPFLERRKTVEAATHQWFAIPETHLPSPWSCDWSRWHGWMLGPLPLPEKLRRRYGIAAALSPVMFRYGPEAATLFEACGTFYLAEKLRYRLENNADHWLYEFSGSYRSVEDFMENADWNEMKKMKRGKSFGDPIAPSPKLEPIPLTHSGEGLRRASDVPYSKCNLLAMTRPEGTWSFRPRASWIKEPWSSRDLPRPLPTIPDEHLPSPFSCAWLAFRPAWYWYPDLESPRYQPSYQEQLAYRWGVPDLEPIMFMADHTGCLNTLEAPTVLRAGESYYLWLFEDDPTDPWLRKFEGTFKSVEDFMENADWNRLSARIEEKAHWFERWEQEEKLRTRNK
ncbi:hypothetical protein MSAN_00816000 [Mycena sanguinolenta]|uniref:Uncharacterized protein n=1 Tax=Mycena sanguinolenta TaxID=230812 RepID=A0A8H6YUT7_9AGAR|nr:hypothetical protein MSAN_00816000 [Mycena sanguinolenta]